MINGVGRGSWRRRFLEAFFLECSKLGGVDTLNDPIECLCAPPSRFSLCLRSREDSWAMSGRNFSDLMHFKDLILCSGIRGWLPFVCVSVSTIVTFFDFWRYCASGSCLFRSFSTRGTRIVSSRSIELSRSSFFSKCVWKRLESILSADQRSRSFTCRHLFTNIVIFWL